MHGAIAEESCIITLDDNYLKKHRLCPLCNAFKSTHYNQHV